MIVLPKIIEKTVDSDLDLDSGHLFTKEAFEQFRKMYNADFKANAKNANKSHQMLTRIYIDKYENIIRAVDLSLNWIYDNTGELAYGSMTIEPMLVLPQLGNTHMSLSLKTINITPDNAIFKELIDKPLLIISDDEVNISGEDCIASAPLETYPELTTTCDIAATQFKSYIKNLLSKP